MAHHHASVHLQLFPCPAHSIMTICAGNAEQQSRTNVALPEKLSLLSHEQSVRMFDWLEEQYMFCFQSSLITWKTAVMAVHPREPKMLSSLMPLSESLWGSRALRVQG